MPCMAPLSPLSQLPTPNSQNSPKLPKKLPTSVFFSSLATPYLIICGFLWMAPNYGLQKDTSKIALKNKKKTLFFSNS